MLSMPQDTLDLLNFLEIPARLNSKEGPAASTHLHMLHRRLLLESCMEAALHLGILLLQALAECIELAVLVDEISQVSLHDRVA